jgi:stress response protein YsnF
VNSDENIKDRKETSSTSAAAAANGNIKEELTSVTKPETIAISKEIMVITPPLIKYSNVVIVRPSFQEKRREDDDSILDKAQDASKSFKQSISVVGEKAKLGNNNNIKKDKIVNKIDHSYKQLDKEDIISQNTPTIPVNEERFSISKNTIVENVKIEKRWITTTKKVEIPVPYEEVYVNDKMLKLFDEKYDDSILSKLKDKILDSIDRDKNKQQHSLAQQENQPRGELISLFDEKDQNNNNQETEKVIPIMGEEIVVSRRTVKIGEIVIKKRRVIDNKKIKIDIKKEKVILEYPDGTTEQITA